MVAKAAGMAPRPWVSDDPSLNYAKWEIREQSIRRKTFEPLLPSWSESVWAMLLDLYIASEEGKQVSTTSLCLAAEIPVTTALRQLLLLCDSGLLERRNDAQDGRRILITMAPALRTAMRLYFRRGLSSVDGMINDRRYGG